jgi:hypothetical protein
MSDNIYSQALSLHLVYLQMLPGGGIREWMSRKHEKHSSPYTHRHTQAKGFLQKISVKEAGELLSLSRNKLKIITGFLTEHCHLKGHLYNWGL